MAKFKVVFGGDKKVFEANKTLAEVKTMIKDAKAAGEMVQAGATMLINPETITSVEEVT